MTNPYDPNRYDEDGLPLSPGSHSQGPQPYGQPGYGQQPYGQQPFGQPSYGHQQPFADPQQGYSQQGFQQPQGGYLQPHQSYPPAGHAPKSWVIAAILAFFLGIFGAHNFYLGYKNRAITQLSLYLGGWVTSFLLIGIPVVFAVSVWAFVEFIMILVRGGKYATDANGMRLD